jgi:DNA-binding MarR family transcriptional regulator
MLVVLVVPGLCGTGGSVPPSQCASRPLGSKRLGHPQTAVLTRLWKDGASSASALADAEGVRPQSMAAIVAALEQRGVIERTPGP